MSLADEREERRQQLTEKIRAEQERLGFESPLPAFLNVLTDYIVDNDIRIEEIRSEVANLRKTFVEHKHYLGTESHTKVMRRLDRAIKDVERRLGRMGGAEEIDG